MTSTFFAWEIDVEIFGDWYIHELFGCLVVLAETSQESSFGLLSHLLPIWKHQLLFYVGVTLESIVAMTNWGLPLHSLIVIETLVSHCFQHLGVFGNWTTCIQLSLYWKGPFSFSQRLLVKHLTNRGKHWMFSVFIQDFVTASVVVFDRAVLRNYGLSLYSVPRLDQKLAILALNQFFNELGMSEARLGNRHILTIFSGWTSCTTYHIV